MNDISASNPLHFQEEFLKAKRNLLWTCTLTILIFFTGISSPGKDSITFPIMSASMDANYLIALNFFVCIYCYWGFLIAEERQRIFNSNITYSKDFENLDGLIKSAINRITEKSSALLEIVDQPEQGLVDRLNATTINFSEVSDNLRVELAVNENSYHKPRNEEILDRHLDPVKMQLENFPITDQYKTTVIEFLELAFDGAVREVFRNSVNDVATIYHKIEPKIFETKQALDDLNNKLDKNQIFTRNIEQISTSLNEIATAMRTLSDDIHKSDKFKLKWYDLGVSHFIFGTSVVLTVAHFACQAF